MASLGSFKKGIVYTKGGLGQTGISTSTGAAPAPTFQFGNALSFDGVNDNVSFTAVNKPALTAGFSVSMWVKFNATPSYEVILGNSASLYNQLIFVSPTQAYFRTRSAGASITYFNFPAISTGTWYYIAVSLVTTVNELWIDGVKYTGTTHNYDNENITFDQIGLSGTNYGQFVIDELALKAGSGLTQQDVDDLYNGGLGQFATDVITDPDIYYRLNGSGTDTTAIDDSGNSNNGTLNNFTGTYWVEHIVTPVFAFGNALSFDGVNDYVSIGTPVSMSSEATVNMWVKFSGINARLISDTSNTATIAVLTNTSVRVFCGGGLRDFVVPAMSLGTWYMITATRNATDGWRVYLNGTESTSGIQGRAGTFNVNTLGNLGSTYSNIVLDEVSILEGTAASDIQIESLYNSGNGANANTVLGSTSLYYRLNGSGTDTTAIDDSGNSNTGTLNNFTGTYWIAH